MVERIYIGVHLGKDGKLVLGLWVIRDIQMEIIKYSRMSLSLVIKAERTLREMGYSKQIVVTHFSSSFTLLITHQRSSIQRPSM